MKRVLFIDDEFGRWIDAFRIKFAGRGLEVSGLDNPDEALTRIMGDAPDVVLLDVMFPGANGILQPKGRFVAAEIARAFPQLPVVMFTSTLADEKYAVDERDFPDAQFLFSKSAFGDEFIKDPYGELARQLLAAIDRRRPEMDEHLGFIIGSGPSMRRAAELVRLVAKTSSTVLISGESGTGKELVARALHQLSERPPDKFIAVNCGALTDEVLESTLFGHERGAFTGAERRHEGYFEQAHNGTLFLDEVNAMSPALQDRLLRVLEDGRVRRMGSQNEIEVDARVIAATNKPLRELVEQGRFRKDLYYRLCVIEIDLPPLRERLDDLQLICRALLQSLNQRLGTHIAAELRSDVVDKLKTHSWPGNIRELENTLERAAITTRSNVLTPGAIMFGENPDAGTYPGGDLMGRIFAGAAGWEDIRATKDPARRREILERLIGEFRHRQQNEPGSAQLAELLGVSEPNMRRILSDCGVRLRARVKEKE